MTGNGFAYKKGDIVELSDARANSYIKHDAAIQYNPGPNEKVLKTSTEDQPKTLSEDCPGYDMLIEAGLDTPDKVLAYEDLTMINGIGDAIAEKIRVFLSEDQSVPLPDNCPGYDMLIEAGLKTSDEVLAYEDLTMINGIDEAIAEKIREFLSE